MEDLEKRRKTKPHKGAEPAVTEYAWAKLNLSLDVTGKRPDGYHDMLMVMQTVSVADRVDLQRSPEPGVHASCNFRYVPTDGRNLAVRAAQIYLDALGTGAGAGAAGEPAGNSAGGQAWDSAGAAAAGALPGVRIRLEKRIPVGAGMAGGSADAAAVLRGMNRLYGNRMDRRELEALAGKVGSDVAFCIAGGTALARGRGELLEDLPPLPDCRIVVCKPGFSISTPELFRRLDEVSLRRHPDTEGMLTALRDGNLREVGIRMYNVFEDVPDRRMRQIAEIKRVLLDHGALGAVMTGTGSAVFGLFPPSEAPAAEQCAQALQKEYRFCRVAEPVTTIQFKN